MTMTYDRRKHHWRSIRLRGHDYTGGGAYFVTIRVKGKQSLFGRIVEAEMILNEAGRKVEKAWGALSKRFASVIFDAFQIMPNHVHAVIMTPGPGLEPALATVTGAPVIQPVPPRLAPKKRVGSGLAPARLTQGSALHPGTQGSAPHQPRLGDIVGAFKSISAIDVNVSSSRAGQPLWLEDYFEHIIRSVAELETIREYIVHNPQRWPEDPENPDVEPDE